MMSRLRESGLRERDSSRLSGVNVIILFLSEHEINHVLVGGEWGKDV